MYPDYSIQGEGKKEGFFPPHTSTVGKESMGSDPPKNGSDSVCEAPTEKEGLQLLVCLTNPLLGH